LSCRCGLPLSFCRLPGCLPARKQRNFYKKYEKRTSAFKKFKNKKQKEQKRFKNRPPFFFKSSL
jgi:hypothetical protein